MKRLFTAVGLVLLFNLIGGAQDSSRSATESRPEVESTTLKPTSVVTSAEMDAYCVERTKEDLSESDRSIKVEAFYSWKIHSCVQIYISNDKSSWGYLLLDASAGFYRGIEPIKSEVPLRIYNSDGYATADGFWVSTDTSDDKQLAWPMAASIICTQPEKRCIENDAMLVMNFLKPHAEEYKILAWNLSGITAEGINDLECGIGHRLLFDFVSKSITVTDYPKRPSSGDFCKPYKSANSYSLHGGSINMTSESEIFSCSERGANSAVLAKVIQYHGHVADKNRSLWMDDGEGGPAATVKSPPHPYSKDSCERLMQKKLVELRSK